MSSDSDVLTPSQQSTKAYVDDLKIVAINLLIGSGLSEVPTGVVGYLEIPFPCTITGWTLYADQSGDIKIDIWNDTYGNYPPLDADTITGANEPEISSSDKAYDNTLSGWTASLAKDDILGFNVDSVATIEQVTLVLLLTRT